MILNLNCPPATEVPPGSNPLHDIRRGEMNFIHVKPVTGENERKSNLPYWAFLRGSTHPQQPCSCCPGGHLTEPNEQNTQQSPGWGRNNVLQFVHS